MDKEMETIPLEEVVVQLADRIGMLQGELHTLRGCLVKQASTNASLLRTVEELQKMVEHQATEMGYLALAQSDILRKMPSDNVAWTDVDTGNPEES